MRRKLTYLDIEPGDRVPSILFSGGYLASAETSLQLDNNGGGEEADASEEQTQPTDKRFLPSSRTVVLSAGGVVLFGATLYIGYRFLIKGEVGDGGGGE